MSATSSPATSLWTEPSKPSTADASASDEAGYHEPATAAFLTTSLRTSTVLNLRVSMLAFAMPGRITRDEVIAVAKLAELELEPDEVDMLAKQIGDILAYAERVRSADTSGVVPTTGTSTAHSTDRADQVTPCFDPATALANAPEPAREAGLFKVPRVIGS
jgi:aspartyl-tRNA(Asn)/glutamyl-tRNA(Gln) amidotransferase subunit C